MSYMLVRVPYAYLYCYGVTSVRIYSNAPSVYTNLTGQGLVSCKLIKPGPNLATKNGPGSDQFWQRKVVRRDPFFPDQFSRDNCRLPSQLTRKRGAPNNLQGARNSYCTGISSMITLIILTAAVPHPRSLI